jgi:hypothetical protein
MVDCGNEAFCDVFYVDNVPQHKAAVCWCTKGKIALLLMGTYHLSPWRWWVGEELNLCEPMCLSVTVCITCASVGLMFPSMVSVKISCECKGNIVGALACIRTGHLQNASQKHYCLSPVAWYKVCPSIFLEHLRALRNLGISCFPVEFCIIYHLT